MCIKENNQQSEQVTCGMEKIANQITSMQLISRIKTLSTQKQTNKKQITQRKNKQKA